MNIDFNAFANRSASQNKCPSLYKPVDGNAVDSLCVGNEYQLLRDHLGTLQQNSVVNFWTFGRYAMHDVLKYCLLQTGPADVTACTWAVTTQAVETLLLLRDKGLLRSFRLWLDPRVKVRNPQPLQMLQLNFPITISPVHAKVTCISNDDWKLSIYGSLNFTSNPQPERGAVCTIPHVWQSDFTLLDRQFPDGSTSISSTDTPAFVQSDTRSAWRNAADYTAPRSNLVEKVKYHQRTDFSFLSSFERTEEGYELSQIKADFYNVTRFADSASSVIDKLIGNANRHLFALVTPPKRRHTVKNFAEAVALQVADNLHLHYYPDAVTASSKHRVNAEFTLTATLAEPIVIIYDDIFTTGSTIRATGALFPDKNRLFLVGIYNS